VAKLGEYGSVAINEEEKKQEVRVKSKDFRHLVRDIGPRAFYCGLQLPVPGNCLSVALL
jgi:hypothetical protein